MDISFLSDPVRVDINKELHGRPAFSLRAPARISHFAYMSGEDGGRRDRRHLEQLCDTFGVARPPKGGRHHMADFGAFFLKWERHTEFTSYTVAVKSGRDIPFTVAAAEALPSNWFQNIPGDMVVALNIELVDANDEQSKEACFAPFWHKDVAGSKVSGSRSSAWSDFRIHDDSFMRLALICDDLSENRTGRLVQRMVEVFTYGHLALMALPVARDVMAQSADIEATLKDTVAQMAGSVEGEDAELHLNSLLKLAARTEHLVAKTSFRFSAAKAYHSLVERRFQETREGRIPGSQRLSSFLERHLVPAMRTCDAASKRLAELARRVDRAAGLLRTQVELDSQRQNKALLASMNRRARVQLRLQETVEGLSVVAISYYALGIIAMALKAMKAGGVPIDVGISTGIAAPFVLLTTFLLIRRVRHAVMNSKR
ncbi:MAG: DUF3422 domain-containing protein [Alphaproteobacteria bacterium]|nr:DUF3422 domain-containing protein [Alphaproteobacteria bacterium]